MRTIVAVSRLLGRSSEHTFDQTNIELKQECSVEEEEGAAAPLGVSGKFPSAGSEVSGSFDGDGFLEEARESGAMGFHDALIGAGNIMVWRAVGDFDDQTVIQAAWPLQNRAASRTTA